MRLRPWLVLVFIALVVPVFGAVLLFNYVTAERVAREAASALVERSLHEAGSRTRELIDPMRTMVQAAAGLASAQTDFLRGASGGAYLSDVLAHGDSVTGVFAGFADGTFRAVLRVRPGVMVQGVEAPAHAAQVRIQVDPAQALPARGTLEFVDSAGRLLGAHSLGAPFDPRSRPWYRGALLSGSLTLSDPYVFSSTGQIGLTVAAPFGSAGVVAGVVGADITLADISRHMAERRVSPNSESLLVDERGQVIAHSKVTPWVAAGEGERSLAALEALGGARAAAALLKGRESPGKLFYIDAGIAAEPTAAVMLALKDALGKPWELLAMAPLSDFSGALHDNNRRILLLGLAALALQILVIFWLSRTMADPLERLSRKVDRIRTLAGEADPAERSRLREIDSLGQAVATLETTVHSFSAYVPRALVRRLVDTGQALSLGGESRYLTLMFTDLEGFSALSERLPSHTLLQQVSAYLSLVSEVVESELGTVDKFIGDGTMAFWGAPERVPDHAWHACVAALRIQRGMAMLNRQWVANGLEPLNVRIGLHSDSVLVGNIGSVERMSYTVLGDGVNVAAYIEGANKAFGTSICVSQAVVREAGHRLCIRPLDHVSVKTRQSSILVYELLGAHGAEPELEPDEGATQLARLTAEAWKCRLEGTESAARLAYRAVLAQRPGDPLAQRMLADSP